MNSLKNKVNKGNIIEQLDFFMDVIKSESIKTRDCDYNPKTGIYLEDKELMENTIFKPGTKFKYGLDKKNKILKIMPSDDIGTSVASRTRKGELVGSVVHVRRKEILEVFKDYEKLEFEIFEDCILVKVKEENLNGKSEETTYSLSKKDVESLTDTWFDEDLRRAVANHTKKHPVLQKVYNVLREPLKFISLFSGIGTMDYSFELEGFDCEIAVEINDSAVETFKANSNRPIFHGDIHNVDFDSIGEIPLVIGGSPCQDFSALNSRKVWDSPKNKLVYKFIEVVKKVKAKVFLLENVPQILTAGGSIYIQAIKDSLPDFEVTVGVLNSDNYGSAQSRERAYILGSRIGKIDMPEPTTPKEKVTVKEAFKGLSDKILNFFDWSKPTVKTVERMKHVPQGGNFKDIPENLRTKGKFSNNFRRLSWDNPSCTMVNLGRTIIIHPEENRVLSVREQARLFGIPDNWEFKGSMFDKQQQVANTVVVQVINSIAKKIKAKFEDVYEKLLMDKFSLSYL